LSPPKEATPIKRPLLLKGHYFIAEGEVIKEYLFLKRGNITKLFITYYPKEQILGRIMFTCCNYVIFMTLDPIANRPTVVLT
jgi:hypothetical protein